MAQRYENGRVNDMSNSNNSIIFIKELITKDLK